MSYVSADFKRHSAAQGFANLILNYDAKQFQVYGYSGVGIGQEDELTVSFSKQASVWRSIQGITDTALAEQICYDQIIDKSLPAAPSMTAKIKLTTEQKHHMASGIDQVATWSKRSLAEEMVLGALASHTAGKIITPNPTAS